ncbi:DUF3617 domain-containing protein [Wenzhouxiangella sp. XN79A]|uniref:DUF3617 domain-containing protein n=1 Tax=Wenzhouxiangella sp. XN79A TaxID=2724193 RepID=UPI00144AB11C|nr:DUF3617 domain-containing protein [Wenzhouxiangella sp. XN79A]NKI34989.1 DUF3617 domain-containing protein [Wenzhouxiangella sp. XN79A]
MIKHCLTALAIAGLSTTALADDPNIEPGMWETTSTVTLDSPQFSLPPQTQSSSDCVTAEDVAQGDAFLDDNEECEITNKDIRNDGMNYSMRCSNPDGSTMTMDAEMSFDGESMSGTVDGQMQSAMGEMTMKVEISGKRTGDC